MIVISREELNRLIELKNVAQGIEEQIRATYESTHRPAHTGGRVSHRTTADPTRWKAQKILQLRESLEQTTAQLDELQYKIELFSLEVDSPLIGCIIRLHYIRGLSWAETSERIYNTTGKKDSCRRALERYMKRLEPAEPAEE